MWLMSDHKSKYSALSFDSGFKQVADDCKNSDIRCIGRIHSVFDKVVNIITFDGKLCTIAQEDIDNGPYTARVKAENMCSFREALLGQGDMLGCRGDCLYLGDKMLISLQNAVLWQPEIINCSFYNRIAVEKNIKRVCDCIINYGGFGGMKYYYMKQSGRDLTNYCPTAIELELYKSAGEFLLSIVNKEYHQINGAVKSLIGLGVGLTPSGDDFLAGFIFTITKLNNPIAVLVRKAVESILEEEARTTEISRHMLMAACEGKVRENIENLIKGIFQQESDISEDTIYNVLSIGSTSGVDLAIGVITGLLYSMG